MTVEEQKWELLKTVTEKKDSVDFSNHYIDTDTIIEDFRKTLSKELELHRRLFITTGYGLTSGVLFYDEAAMRGDWDKLNNCVVKEESIDNKIASIKKQLKHCKNPMENKKLNQELNALYKEKKKKKYQEINDDSNRTD